MAARASSRVHCSAMVATWRTSAGFSLLNCLPLAALPSSPLTIRGQYSGNRKESSSGAMSHSLGAPSVSCRSGLRAASPGEAAGRTRPGRASRWRLGKHEGWRAGCQAPERPSPGDPGRRRARSRQPWPRAGPETAVCYLRSMTPMTADPEAPLTAARRWMITAAVMIVTVTQVLDTTVTNVALPHIQGALSAAVDEVSWVLTSYLAANAVVLPATGWLAAVLGRKRLFLICTVMFTLASALCGLAPNIETLIVARILQGLGGGPLMPLSQAILWEIFPLRQRGMAMATWGMGIMMAPIFGPLLGGFIADNWSWRWIFYINVPIGFVGFLATGAVLFDPPYLRKPTRVDLPGLLLMAVGFLSLQLFLDQGERHEWFASSFVTALAVLAAGALVGFLIRELTTPDPIFDLSVYADRNFAAGSLLMLVLMIG